MSTKSKVAGAEFVVTAGQFVYRVAGKIATADAGSVVQLAADAAEKWVVAGVLRAIGAAPAAEPAPAPPAPPAPPAA